MGIVKILYLCKVKSKKNMNMQNKIMGKQEKDLLLKDICARLPYKTLISIDGNRYRMEEVCNALIGIDTYKITVDGCNIEQIKPYLFPLSSMTEEQKNAAPFESSLLNAFTNGYISLFEDEELTIDELNRLYDWLNKNHFDYRGLIPMDLAIDATGLNIY